MIDFGNGFGLNDLLGFAATFTSVGAAGGAIWHAVHRNLEKNFARINAEQRRARLELQRIEILSAIYHTPDDAATIYTMLDAYFAAGGNSYIHDAAKNWERSRPRKNRGDKIFYDIKEKEEK